MVLNVLLVIYASLALIDIVFMLTLHFLHDRRGYYKTAILIWVGIFFSFIADGLIASKAPGLNHLFGFPLIMITTYGLAKLARDIYRFELPFKSYAFFSLSTWLLGVALHFGFGASFTLSSLVICIGIVAPSLTAAYKLFRLPQRLNILDKLFASILAAQALHILDYPFLRPIEAAAVFGFSLGLVLVYLASILIPVVINRRLSADLNASLEQKVEERTNQLLELKQKFVNAAKMSTLGEMAGGVAHEINNPLATIKSLSSQLHEVVDDEPLNKPQIKAMAGRIEKTTDRIAKIVQGLRSFSRDGSQDPFEPIKVHLLFEETLSLCSERFKYSEIQLSIDAFDPELHFSGRMTEASQVLLNLLNNAHDAILALKEKWIKLSVKDERDWIEIHVTDSGSGIPIQLQEKIFQPFFTTKDIGKGTGMGLSISSGIIQEHGGQLTLDNRSPNTRFVMRLPKNRSSKS